MNTTSIHLSSAIRDIGASGWTTLHLQDIVKQLDIGVHDYEKGVKQPVRFDIEILLEGSDSPREDIIGEVLDYEYLHRSIELAISERHALLETLASSILDSILNPDPVLAAVVSLTKIEPLGFDGKFGCTMARVK